MTCKYNYTRVSLCLTNKCTLADLNRAFKIKQDISRKIHPYVYDSFANVYE